MCIYTLVCTVCKKHWRVVQPDRQKTVGRTDKPTDRLSDQKTYTHTFIQIDFPLASPPYPLPPLLLSPPCIPSPSFPRMYTHPHMRRSMFAFLARFLSRLPAPVKSQDSYRPTCLQELLAVRMFLSSVGTEQISSTSISASNILAQDHRSSSPHSHGHPSTRSGSTLSEGGVGNDSQGLFGNWTRRGEDKGCCEGLGESGEGWGAGGGREDGRGAFWEEGKGMKVHGVKSTVPYGRRRFWNAPCGGEQSSNDS